MKATRALAIGALLGLVIAAPIAAQDTTTTIRVSVADESGAPVAGQEVFVVVSDGEEVVDELTGTTGEDGAAVFADISAGANSARAVTLFEGYPYQSESVDIGAGAEAALSITVFSVGATDGNLHINMLHLIINVLEPGVYQAIQLVEVMNVGGQASYTGEEFGDRQVGMVIPVPSAATGIVPVGDITVSGLDSNNLALDGNRLLDLRSVPPGEHQKVIQYDLVTGGGGEDVELVVPYPTAQVSILAGPGLDAVEISSDQLNELPPATDIPGGPFAHWSSDVLAAGDTLRFRLGPQPPALTVASWSLLGLALALFASAVASLWGGRPAGQPGERERLIAQIARIDQSFESGVIGEDDYYDQRSDAIGRLIQMSGGPQAASSEPGA